MNYHWNWGVFFTEAAQNQTYLDWLLAGLKTTVVLGLSSWIIALVIGSVLGVLRTVPNKWLSGLAAAYVEVFRNIPLIVQLFIWYFVMPELVPGGDYIKQMNPATAMFLSAMLCLGTFTAARVRTGALGYQFAAARPAQRRPGDGLHACTDVSLRDVADVVPHHRAAAYVGVSEYLQELCRGLDDRLA